MIGALRKEMLLQWRTRAQAMAAFIFGSTSLLLFSFAVGPNAEALRTFSAGFLWLGLLLSSTLTLADSFHAETENHALEGLLLAGASARAIYYGKAVANWVSSRTSPTATQSVTVRASLTSKQSAAVPN